LQETEKGKLFINSLIEFLPAMTAGYGLLVGDSEYWKKAKDANMARIFMFAFLNLNFTAVKEYMSADYALEFLWYTKMSSSDMVTVWPKLFEVSQFKGLGKITLSKIEARGNDQDRKRFIRMRYHQRLHKKLTGNDVRHGFHLTFVPFRSISLICKQPLMLKKAAMTQGPVYKNMSCLLQAGYGGSRSLGFSENVLANLKAIAKLESLLIGHHFTVSSLYIRYTKEFLADRFFVLSQDFHTLPLEVQGILLSEARLDRDTPASNIRRLQKSINVFRNASKQAFTATELESANKLDWFVLDVVCPGSSGRYVLLQYNQPPEQLSSKDGTRDIIPGDQYYQALWGPDKSSPNNNQYVGIVNIDVVCTALHAELLIIPTVDASDVSQRSAILKVKGSKYRGIAVIWWDPESKLVKLQEMFPGDDTLCQVTIPQHLIFDYCPKKYGLEHRMIIVRSRDRDDLPTLEEAAQMLAMKDRQLHDLKDQEYPGDWSMIVVRPKCLASLEYTPESS
jgi:hypothetical protein